ncbi:TPA: hypothetical protein MCR44_003785 [Klebsiella pneumoniae]|nr:hypothetical protein [Klebsiella pneumoniae]
MTTAEAFEELDLSDGREATVSRQYGYDEQRGSIRVESQNGDIDAISRLTRDDAIALIGALQRAFDIPDRAAELELLLEMREETTLNLMEKSVMAGIANIMYENGLKRATITPQNVMSGFVPSLSIDVSVPGVVIYTLNGEPLNGKPDTE